MTQAPHLPVWAALIVGALVLLGAAITLIGASGLVRLKSFYDRAHAPALGSTMGMVCILAASITCFSVLQSRPVIHEVLILTFITLTTPVTLMLLGRAALYRDQQTRATDTPSDGGKDTAS